MERDVSVGDKYKARDQTVDGKYPRTWITNASKKPDDIDGIIARTLIDMNYDIEIHNQQLDSAGNLLKDTFSIHGKNQIARYAFDKLANSPRLKLLYERMGNNKEFSVTLATQIVRKAARAEIPNRK